MGIKLNKFGKQLILFIKTNERGLLLSFGIVLISLIGFFSMVYLFVVGITAESRPDNKVFHESPYSFEKQIGVKIPNEIKKSDIQCYGSNNWMGDGVVECSFRTNAEEIKKILNNKPNGNGWQRGPYGSEACINSGNCRFINSYTGASDDIKLLDGKNIFYSFKSRSKTEGYPEANFDLYIVDTNTYTVMIIESDS